MNVLSLTKIKKLNTVSVVYGEEAVLVDEARSIFRGLLKPHNIERADWENLNDYPMMFNNAPDLFGGTKLKEVIAHAAPLSKENREALPRLCETVQAPDTLLVALYFPVAKSTTKQPAWFKALTQHATMLSADRQNAAGTESWVAHWLDKPATAEALRLIGEHCEGNLTAAKNVALKINISDNGECINEQAAKAALSDGGHYDVFDLVDSALAGQGRRALQILRALYEAKTAEPLILWALTDTTQKLLALKNGGDVRATKNQLQRLRSVAHHAPVEKIHRLLSRAAKTDRVIKGVCVGDAKIALLGLTADLATVGRHVKIRLPISV